jgi:CRISPR-associated endonuclease Cas1
MDTLSDPHLIPHEIGKFDINDEWTNRGEFWRTNNSQTLNRRDNSKREPLILGGHGIRLRINHGALEIRNGFTHYPQQREEIRIFPGEILRPSRIILLDGSGAITLDVLSWLAAQDIPLVQLDFQGRVVSAIGSAGIGTDPGLLKLQLMAAQNPAQALQLATWFLRQKLTNSCRTLVTSTPPSDARHDAISQMEADIARLDQGLAESIRQLQGLEGPCAALYFLAWRGIPIQWKGNSRTPIPEAWHEIGHRRARQKLGNRFARHPVQAMLNYAYATMESRLRIETIRVGLDQSIGYLHLSREGRAALLLDLIEPMRPMVDQAILRFVRDQTFSPADFTLAADGTCRLHPQLARRVVAEVEQVEAIIPLLNAFLSQIGHDPSSHYTKIRRKTGMDRRSRKTS